MLRLAGADIPGTKSILIGLTYIYGIGIKTSRKILQLINIDANIRVKDLQESQLADIRTEINKLNEKGLLRREISLMNIKNLMSINSYRGRRHNLGLPARGQNTRNNAKTSRRNRQINLADSVKKNNIKKRG
ncbi:30S ribosomal protein S13 ['Planchonia careya' phytoplasma]|nr:30S ribosomal protein S13 ['Planchonia careya' phytoplasma]MDO8030126.1 30S ribosomal protein S13 ['Planchonia careya' phytoplasma]